MMIGSVLLSSHDEGFSATVFSYCGFSAITSRVEVSELLFLMTRTSVLLSFHDEGLVLLSSRDEGFTATVFL